MTYILQHTNPYLVDSIPTNRIKQIPLHHVPRIDPSKQKCYWIGSFSLRQKKIVKPVRIYTKKDFSTSTSFFYQRTTETILFDLQFHLIQKKLFKIAIISILSILQKKNYHRLSRKTISYQTTKVYYSTYFSTFIPNKSIELVCIFTFTFVRLIEYVL